MVTFPSVNFTYLWSSTYTFKCLIFICLHVNVDVHRCPFWAACGLYSRCTYFESWPSFSKYLIFTSILEKKFGLIRYPSTLSCVHVMIIATFLHMSIFTDAATLLWLSVKMSLTLPYESFWLNSSFCQMCWNFSTHFFLLSCRLYLSRSFLVNEFPAIVIWDLTLKSPN